jgi:hypothetical protein
VQTSFTSTKGFLLEDETPVRLRLNRTISSADAHVGDTVDFEVLDDISINGTLVIPKGGLAFATVTEAQAKRRMARGGKLDINIDYVKLASGEKAALRAVRDVKGGGNAGTLVSQVDVNQTPTSSLTVAKVHDDSASVQVSPRSTIGAFADGSPETRHDGVTLNSSDDGRSSRSSRNQTWGCDACNQRSLPVHDPRATGRD